MLLEAIVAWGARGRDRALRRHVRLCALGPAGAHAHLVRDRFGEKPLYYGWAGRDFVFGSELKALSAHPRFERGINRARCGLFAARTVIPAPFSIYQRVFKLQPGCILTVSRDAAKPLGDPPEEGEPRRR